MPDEVISELGIRVVHGLVHWDGPPWSGSSDAFWKELRSRQTPPSTAPPGPEALAEGYAGTDPVLGVHVSAELSRTVEYARRAAGADGRVHVVDSRSLSVGTGLAVQEAATWARAGADLDRLDELLDGLVSRLHVYAVLEDIVYVVSGGRAPLVEARGRRHARHVVAIRGHAIPLKDLRRRKAAIDELMRHAADHGRDGVICWAVGHGDAADVGQFVSDAQATLGGSPRFVVPVGPSVGAHAGPDALVLAFVQA